MRREKAGVEMKVSLAGQPLKTWMILAFLAILTLFVFSPLWAPDVSLFTTDNNIGQTAQAHRLFPRLISGWWNDGLLLGMPSMGVFNFSVFAVGLLSPQLYSNSFHILCVVIGSLMLGLFFKTNNIRGLGLLLGVTTVYWLGNNFTLIYAGHDGKFATMMLAAAALWCVEKAAVERHWGWRVLAGGFVGGMFLEQLDVALFVAMFIAAYALFSLVLNEGWNWRAVVAGLVPMGLVVILMGGASVLVGYTVNVKGVAAMDPEKPQELWDYCTQWSEPPDETIEFIAPGYMGWRSGEPEGPYWGRSGRSAEWDRSRQGFMNFRLEAQYIGAIPVCFALFGLVAALLGGLRKQGGGVRSTAPPALDDWADRRAKILFWSVVAIVALLLSYGKYFPLYALFYKLPLVSSIRNPVKFIHVLQLALGVLAAYGLDLALKLPSPALTARDWARWFTRSVFVVAGVLAFWAMGQTLARDSMIGTVSQQGWGSYASAIVDNKIQALWHAVFMAVCAGIFLLILTRRTVKQPASVAGLVLSITAWAVVTLVAADAWLLSRHYVKSMPMSSVAENPVIAILKKDMPEKRVALLSQDSFYNSWLTYLFPYHGINAVNFAQMPRMPEAYKRWLGTVGRNPVRLWQMSAVGYVLAPAKVWTQIQADPSWRDAFDLVYSYNVGPAEAGVSVVPASPQYPGQHVVLRLKKPAPRVVLVGQCRVAADEEALRQMSGRDFVPFEKVFIPADEAAQWKGLEQVSGAPGAAGQCVLSKYSPGHMEITVNAARPCVLRVAEKFDPDWKATLDGARVFLGRVDFLSQGVFIPAGQHQVVLDYDPPLTQYYVQGAGLAVCFIALLGLGLSAWRRRRQA